MVEPFRSTLLSHSRSQILSFDRTTSTVWLFELTVSFETNVDQAHTRKKERHTLLSTEIEESGYDCKNVPFEVWSRGHIYISNHSSLATLHGITTPKSN